MSCFTFQRLNTAEPEPVLSQETKTQLGPCTLQQGFQCVSCHQLLPGFHISKKFQAFPHRAPMWLLNNYAKCQLHNVSKHKINSSATKTQIMMLLFQSYSRNLGNLLNVNIVKGSRDDIVLLQQWEQDDITEIASQNIVIAKVLDNQIIFIFQFLNPHSLILTVSHNTKGKVNNTESYQQGLKAWK